MTVASHAVCFPTDLGWAALRGEERGGGWQLVTLVFGDAGPRAATRRLGGEPTPASSAPPEIDQWVELLQRFSAGEPVPLTGIPVCRDHLTPFARQVSQACSAIPYGATRSYGELARRVGRPAAARAVGAVMASNRTPLVVPCHRVLGAGGRLGGFSAPQGVAMKRRLLQMEGALLL